MKKNKDTEPIVSTILQQNQDEIDDILKENGATLAGIHTVDELTIQKKSIQEKFKTHMNSHRGNLQDTCDVCQVYLNDIYVRATAIKIRRENDKNLNKKA